MGWILGIESYLLSSYAYENLHFYSHPNHVSNNCISN